MTITTTSPKQNGPEKKRYESPRLEVYGDIRMVTEALGLHSAQSDGILSQKTS
jgi:hypothetical protein